MRPVRRRGLLIAAVSASAVAAAGTAVANEDLQQLVDDPANWAMPTGNYANTRYSELDQITAENAGELSPA